MQANNPNPKCSPLAISLPISLFQPKPCPVSLPSLSTMVRPPIQLPCTPTCSYPIPYSVGTGYTKMGFAGNSEPSFTFPTVIATREGAGGSASGGNPLFSLFILPPPTHSPL